MFSKATRKFVNEIDPDGCLIPVSRLNESDNLSVVSVVIKRNPSWFWQKPKFIPTDFTLNDVLLGEDPIEPGLIETDFLKYNGTIENSETGNAEANVGPAKMNIEGKGLHKMASSFGSLTKQEVDVQKLLCDTKNRCLDLQHSLLKQVLQRGNDVFALVKERIITTQTCTVTETVQEGGSCTSFLGLTVPKKIQVSVKNGSLHSDSKVSIEIPAKTALAYSLMELNVKSTGQFELCLLPDTYGYTEVDGLNSTNATLLNTMPNESPVQKLQQEWNKLQIDFEVLSGLPASTRSLLFPQITLLLKDKAAIRTLDFALRDLIEGRKPDLSSLDNLPSLKKAAQTTLELFKETEGAGHEPLERVTIEQHLEPSALTAINILTSALKEMTESTLSLLGSCCSCTTIQALQQLVRNVLGNTECSLKDSTLAPLAEKDTYCKVQELFGSFNVLLSKEEELIQVQISNQQEAVSPSLCIAIFGLASLSTA
ncbi:gasdermin Eb [Tachysurus fulvidraco]|uniref:gasdermin Eb n=1 Tax=Tachysurus fulvidraco TaxID=1234273 RepID=UPI000F4E02A7|nr:gasdermin Eb [Tachysurus fulvidraco]